MELFTKLDKQIVNFSEVVSINKSLSKQNFYLKNLVSNFFKYFYDF